MLYIKKNLRKSAKVIKPDNVYSDNGCNISPALIFIYLEHILDHACYIADSVDYIVNGITSPRR